MTVGLISVASTQSGWTPIANSVDTNEIFVSDSTGSDAGSGTFASPWKTIAHAVSGVSGGTLGSRGLTSGKPDHVYLKSGDTFSGQQISFNQTGGRSSTEPMVFTSYDGNTGVVGSGARPIIDSQDVDGVHLTNGTYQNLSFINLEIYPSKRDPASGNFAIASTQLDAKGFNFTNVTGTNILIEGCYVHLFSSNVVFADAGTSKTFSNISIRRNIIADSYVAAPLGGSQGFYIEDCTSNLLIEQNVLDHNGWNETLNATTTGITIATGTPGTITWPNAFVPQNDTQVAATTSGGGLTSGTQIGGTQYFVVNRSGSTFQIASSQGGTALAISAGFPTSWIWLAPGYNIFNHNVYLHEDTDQGPATVQQNIITRASNVGSQLRKGSVLFNNYLGGNSIAGTNGNFAGSTTYNVVTQMSDKLGPGSYGNGLEVIANANGLDMSHNIVAHTATSSHWIFSADAAAINSASWSAGQATFVLTGANANYGIAAGATMVVTGMTPSGYNGTYTVTSATFGSGTVSIVVALVSNPGAATVMGELSSSINTNLGNNIVYDVGGADFISTSGGDGAGTTIGTSSTNGNQFNLAAGTYTDPTRDVGPYNASLGGSSSLAAFLTNARANSKASWNVAYTAPALNNYVRVGFNMATI